MYHAREQLLRVRYLLDPVLPYISPISPIYLPGQVRYLLGLVRRREKLKRHAEEISQVRGYRLVVGVRGEGLVVGC